MAPRHRHWKVQKSSRPEKVWLFDLQADAEERVDLARSEQHAQVLGEMLLLLERVNASQKKPMWPALSEMPVLVDKFLVDAFEEGDEYIYWPN